MRIPSFPLVAAAVLLAAPAFAQTSTTGTSDQSGSAYSGQSGTTYPGQTGTYSNQTGTSGYQSGANTYQNPTGTGAGTQAATGGYSNQTSGANQNGTSGSWNQRASNWSGGWHQGMGVTSDAKERIRQSMMQSGFKDVVVIPEAFVIRAQAPDGSHVVMLLRPDELTGLIEPTQTGSTYNPSEGNGAASTYGGSSTAPYSSNH